MKKCVILITGNNKKEMRYISKFKYIILKIRFLFSNVEITKM